MPKVTRPDSWDGYDGVDVIEAARRIGRTVEAIKNLVKKGKLLRLESGDRRVIICAKSVDAFKRQQRPVQLRLLTGRKS